MTMAFYTCIEDRGHYATHIKQQQIANTRTLKTNPEPQKKSVSRFTCLTRIVRQAIDQGTGLPYLALLAVNLFVGTIALGQETLKTNDDPNLEIHTDYGDRVLEYDFDAFNVGIAEYPDGPTGATVLHFPAGARAAVDIRGGSPGFVGDYGYLHAISLAGGSLLGLEAVSGVASGLLAKNDYQANWESIPLVSGGIIFDFGPRTSSIYPDKRLGRKALEVAKPNRFPLGARGAGISATVGKLLGFDRMETAGQGAAFIDTGGIKVFACVVLNAVGAVVDRERSRCSRSSQSRNRRAN